LQKKKLFLKPKIKRIINTSLNLALVSNNKNVDIQEHKSIRARRDCESERARRSGCRLSVACETQTKYTRQQIRRQQPGERLPESYGKQQQNLLKQMHISVQKLQQQNAQAKNRVRFC